MKKITVLFLLFALCAAVLPAAADSVWMPMDDYFFETWQPESDNSCESLTRVYYMAAGDNGYVTAVKTPVDQTKLQTYPNGTEFMIAFICGRDNNLWGAVEAVRLPGAFTFTIDHMGTSGYISMNDLVRAYDSEAFIEDHQPEIHAFAENGYDFCSGQELVMWSYPNSGVQLQYVTADYIKFLCMDYSPDSPYKMFNFGAFYIDPDGNNWVQITLRRPTETGWFCLNRMTEGGQKPVY